MTNTLDLDLLVPEQSTVKVNGKVYTLQPLRLKAFLHLQQTLQKIKKISQEEAVDAMSDIFESMRPSVPEIDDMNLTMPQAFALLEFIYRKEQTTQHQPTEKKTELSATP